MSERKLGKAPARHDPRSYRLGPVLAERLIAIPDKIDWAPDVAWPMWGNDTLGCCTQVSVASAIRCWSGAAQGTVTLTTPQVIANYSAESGYVPDTPATDRGAVELDVLNHWCRVGYERPGAIRDYLTAFGTVEPHERDGVRRAIAALGGLYIGVQVPNYIMQTRGDWVVAPNADQTIIGGHAVWLHGYDADFLFFNSWGQSLRMAWDWFETYCDEAYGLVSRQNWLGIRSRSPQFEDIDTLLAELRAS
ncbi:hypothetical protein AA101099_2637 [Neoasaia chiangmaiensis NBRC 101099]|uniref:Uncharacterized protein n=1 Tax=Neoasaia chiangmaiensis TaxID=320497 RepID=A0A1U9KPH3_9PROT|nr:hypothetical protein [Neoasaia chiangmaiensis]AQS87697.1 hypothetical protein A0U93_06865 [Neoasaia chiangmaiensis]GBR41823.1 hypothetical protein AA101099_2637 [Neoasaia chiangmaiensis NBRC 101099]GEN14286.1 hypothetical protein NCH01_07170 [Neoasaia chiangmaiensis]